MAPSFWEKTKGTSKKGFDKAWHTLDKLGDPVNRLSNRVGAEAFWPMTLDRESDKAARILRSFCKDGFYADEETEKQSTDAVKSGKIDRPKGKQRVLKKIPTEVIKRAKGLAIFTTMRTGLWLSGSGGSGVLLAKIPETGEWSPPSGIMLHTAGIGFLAGVDIYDCVVVINTYEALEAFKKVRCTLGGEVSASAGPVGMGGVLDSEVHKRQAPIWTYMKSRGLYAGVQVDGTIIIERTDENERFYGERISVTDILAGKAKRPPTSIKTLIQTVKAAQGDKDVDESLVSAAGEPTPGDVEVLPASGSSSPPMKFGIPAPDDPDPFGVKALEAEGLFIREAGTKTRPHVNSFEFRPSPTSPIYSTFRHSVDSSPRNSWRTSVQSYASIDRGTQTDEPPLTARTSISRASSRSNRDFAERTEKSSWDHEERGWETIIPEHPVDHSHNATHDGDDDLVDDDVEIHEVSSATVTKCDSFPSSPVEDLTSISPKRQSPTFTRARLVTIPKRVPPALPPRNPYRGYGSMSTPVSPTVGPPSPSKRSVVSSLGMAELSSFAELPLDVKNDASSVSSAEASHLHNGNIDKDEFHSISTVGTSDSASDGDFSAKDASVTGTSPSKTEDTYHTFDDITDNTLFRLQHRHPSDVAKPTATELEHSTTITEHDYKPTMHSSLA
ncbi:hypothetical protein BDV27DRAFT_13157 [Aspergillus caelatus]|uniref:Ysc84 actin-binding domain-containing protein n=2 Tax=Aspergillus subgen. Circumdati TaxID=2720871 RepID=A0A5N6ZZC4_9EURO|nr:uncharacterized protein BDV27DRAFT_13157 [Aspergillus caelatus]KAE8362937.1 hypothetical protein BDV27DRAFT_13157 [Aspergillus caelatus]KAE8418237.1 hypothetical protein BDV36DRAFT_162207 [Aspergillus pseudocaelatus]